MTIFTKSAVALAGCLYILFPILAGSQVQRAGQIVGTVRDPQGAAISHASVEVSNVATGQQSAVAVVTDQFGNFSFGLLPPGTYRVGIAAPGFAPVAADAVHVDPAGTATVEAILSAAPSKYVVMVQE